VTPLVAEVGQGRRVARRKMRMNEFVHRRQYQGRTITHTWVGEAAGVPARVHTLAFTADGEILLVGGAPGGAEWWLPGGGIEVGESPEAALARELREEAAATVEALRPLGAQRVDDPGTGSELRAFYWTRVTLADEYAPEHEVAQRRLVGPDAFLDALSWGRRGPMAARLLDRALAIERELRAPSEAPADTRDGPTGRDRGAGQWQPS
jgi:ADP-ribose pyrophosphatase YjhB (NUDIX family)